MSTSNFDPKKYQEELRTWLREWIVNQDTIQPWGWKSLLEKQLNMPKGYIYKLPAGKLEFDIINLVKIANRAYLKPSDILKEIESRLKK